MPQTTRGHPEMLDRIVASPASPIAPQAHCWQSVRMSPSRRISCCLLAGVILVGCSAGSTTPDAAQCSVLSGAAIEGHTGLSASDGVVFEHEESGDGTWCLYEVNGARIELQFHPSDRATFDARREAAGREGADLVEFDDIGDAAFFGSNGIPKTTVFVDRNLLVVQSLDAVSEGAQLLTSSVARAAADRCCPD